MSRKKKHEHVNHERWLVSYADFITLLFAFFVVLFASGQSDKHKQKQIATAIQTAFTQMGAFQPASKQLSLGGEGAASGAAAPLDAQAAALVGAEQRAEQQEAQRITAAIESPTGKPHTAAGASVSMTASPQGLVVSLHEGGFFDSGSAALRSDAMTTLAAISSALPAGALRIEGHTDNMPVHSALYASNWELSSARAAAVARFLLEHAQRDPSQLSVAGYAEFHPAASNATPEGRAQNRRVDIVVLKSN